MRLPAIRLLVLPAILVALSLLVSTGSKTAHHVAVGGRDAAAKCPQGLVRERGDGYDRDKASCQRLGHPESYADLLKANSSLSSRSTAPFSTLKPGAFAHAIAQKNALAQQPAGAAAAGDGNWTPASTTPLDASNQDFDPTNANIVYAATGDGLFRSTDDGQSFTNVNLRTSPDCQGNSFKKDCFLANMVTDVVVQGPANSNTSGPNAKPGSVLAVVGWRA